MPPGALSEKTKASYLVAPAALGWGPLPPRNANWAAGRASGEQVCCSSSQGSVFTVAALLASLPWPGPLPWVPPPWPPRGLQGSVGAHRAQILLSSILARQPWAGAVPLTGRGDHLGPPCQVVEDQMWPAQRPARGQAGTGCGQSSSPPRDSLSPARHPLGPVLPPQPAWSPLVLSAMEACGTLTAAYLTATLSGVPVPTLSPQPPSRSCFFGKGAGLGGPWCQRDPGTPESLSLPPHPHEPGPVQGP